MTYVNLNKTMRARIGALVRGGVTVLDHRSLVIDEGVSVAPGCVLGANVVLMGKCQVDGDVVIHQGCELIDVHVRERARIKMCSQLTDVQIGAHTTVGPYSQLSSVDIGPFATVGSHTILRRTTLGERALVGGHCHLDATIIGARARVGSGVITANYDGANRWRIAIADGAHIGPGCVLIGPMLVGEDATISAGSIVYRDAPARELTIARAKQVTIEGWQRPERKGVELQKGKRTHRIEHFSTETFFRSSLAKLHELIDSDATEAKIHTFLVKEYWVLGRGYQNCISRITLGNRSIGDLALETSGGLYELVEIKRPTAPLFRRTRHDLLESEALKKAVAQLHRYLDYCETYRLSESHLRGRDFQVSKGRILMGRTRTKEEREWLQSLNRRYARIEVLSYDELLALGRSTLEVVARSERQRIAEASATDVGA